MNIFLLKFGNRVLECLLGLFVKKDIDIIRCVEEV